MKIGKRHIGEEQPPYLIADIAANHDGDLDRAFRLIELAKEAGADAAKFQNFQASRIVSKNGFSGMGKKLSHQANWKKSVYEIYEEASISWEWTPKLKTKCDEVGIEYFSSPYDFESVDHIDPFVNVFKIGSGDITWLEMLEYIAKKGKPVMLATGSSTFEDVERAVSLLLSKTSDLILMQCNTNYNGSSENFKFVNLNVLKTYGKRWPGLILGLSDHTPGHAAVLGAVALGAKVIEKHFTDDNGRDGSDHKFSMNPVTWREMVDRVNELYVGLGDGEKRIEENEKETAIVQRRGIYYSKGLSKGRVICREDLLCLRPILPGGIPPYRMDNIIGKRLIRDVRQDERVDERDIENAER